MAKNEIFLHARKRGHSVVENALLDDASLTGMAKYLLIQFCSHRQGDWKISMKDIIKRSKNGRDAHYSALKELIHNKYVARIRVTLKGLHVEVIYIYGQVKEDVSELLEETIQIKESEGFTCRIEFGEPLPENPYVDSEPSEPQKTPLPENPNVGNPNAENQNYTNNQGRKYQSTKINNNNSITNNDDDIRTSPSGSSALHNEDEINMIIDTLREATKDELTNRSFKAVVRKVVDKYNQGEVTSFRDYLMTALVKKIEDLELRRIQENAKSASKDSKRKTREQRLEELKSYKRSDEIPLYNWLEE